ncbi:MAG: L,D-transpeptidase [Candidatus Nanopelagicales bacterium]
MKLSSLTPTLPLAAGALLLTTLTPLLTPAAGAAEPVEIRGLVTEHTVDAGTRVTDRIRVLPAGTTLQLQRKADQTWSVVGTVTPSGTGAAAVIAYPAAELGVTKYRLSASATVEHDAFLSPPIKIIASQDRGTITGWGTRTLYLPRRQSVTQEVRATPAGAQIVVQRRTCPNCEWTDLGGKRIGADHRVTLTTGPVGTGTRQFRAYIPAQELVRHGTATRIRTVFGYGRVPPVDMIPSLLNRLMRPLGMPVVTSSSTRNGMTARVSCAARELAGFSASRSQPPRKVRARWLATDKFRAAPSRMLDGVNVSVRCQAAYFVRNGKVLRAVPVSTGRAGYRTRTGDFRIYRSVNGVETSQSYPEDHWNMYRSLYFSGGQALHGSYSDAYVVTYPASHGCVRMLHHDVDWLWRKGWTVGTSVRVYGDW